MTNHQKHQTINFLNYRMNQIISINGKNLEQIYRLRKQTKMLEDLITVNNINLNLYSNGVNFLSQYQDLDWFKSKLSNFHTTHIVNRIDDIFEISYINNLNNGYFFEKTNNDHICTIRLKNGILHCDYDCAFFDNKGNRQYYLNGLLVKYEQWNKTNRINKLLKIKNRITNES